MADLIETIATELGIPEDWVSTAVETASYRFRRLYIKKRSGGNRAIFQPSVETKVVQYWLMRKVLDRLSISGIATAFEPGCSIVNNASAHANSWFSVRIDLSDFFPSIKFSDFDALLRNSAELPTSLKDLAMSRLVRNTCFIKNKLPIGYPSSPRIANIVMREIDEALLRAINMDRARFGSSVITRYADDFVFSTDKRGACAQFLVLLREILRSTTSPRLRINEDKTRFMSRRGGSTLVTGLRVKEDGRVGVHPNYRSSARLLLKLYAKGRLKSEDIEKLRGHLSFIRFADPALYTKWAFKFDQEMGELESGNLSASYSMADAQTSAARPARQDSST